MKILHVSHLYHPSEGGVQFWFKNVSERLVKDYGDQVTVVTTDSYYGPERKIYKKIEPASEIINGVEVVRFGYRRWHLKYSSLVFRAMRRVGLKVSDELRAVATGPYSKEMKQYLITANADAICASSSNYYYMQLPIWRTCNFFYFGSIHLSEDESKPVLTRLQLKTINASKLYLANTQYEKRRLVNAGVSKEKIKVLGVGVDQKLFEISDDKKIGFREKLGVPQDAMVIGYAGRIERTKSVLVLVKSFAQIAVTNKNIYLVIAGSGSDYVVELKQYCSQLPGEINERIKWKVNFDLSEKAPLFHNLDVLVLPSSNESFGIVFLEAWVCKKPVIGASIGAVRDVIKEDVDGLLMEVDNVDSLTKQLSKLISNKDLRNELGRNGYDKVLRQYTWDIITARLRNYYKESVVTNTKFNLKIPADV